MSSEPAAFGGKDQQTEEVRGVPTLEVLYNQALQVFQDLMVTAKSEKVRLDAAQAVVEYKQGTRGGGQSLAFTFNMPPEQLVKTLQGLKKLSTAEKALFEVAEDV